MDMGEYFPYLGPCDRTKASTVLVRWECSIGVLDVTARYGAVPTTRRDNEKAVFRRYRGQRVVYDDGRCVVCNEKNDCVR